MPGDYAAYYDSSIHVGIAGFSAWAEKPAIPTKTLANFCKVTIKKRDLNSHPLYYVSLFCHIFLSAFIMYSFHVKLLLMNVPFFVKLLLMDRRLLKLF